ncbi:MAG: PD-(D/E)XK nuclease family protein [Clostridiales bacterium]|nr:PD-(D/E)XK nuclease family protein [Clostridiales bacterium]
MSLGLILGRAGSGKTETCIRQIGQELTSGEEKEFVLLTPEQATFANEKRILATLGNQAGFRVKVMSFRRFVHWVLEETGGGLQPALDSAGKNLILRSILEKRKDELRAFRLVWDKSGFAGRLAELMDEMRIYKVEPEALMRCLGRAAEGSVPAGDLADRLADMGMIYREYEEFLARGWLDQAGELALLCRKLPLWPRLEHILFWLDGFHGFTPAEFDVVSGLLEAGCPVKAAFTLDPGGEERTYEEDELFYPTWETVRDLRGICRAKGYAMEPPMYMGEPGEGRFAGNPDLARLEKALAWQPLDSGGSREGDGQPLDSRGSGEGNGLPPDSGGSGEGNEPPSDSSSDRRGARSGKAPLSIRLESCGDIRQEVERLALEIVEAARDEGLRYQDMTVLLRQPESYETLIRGIFPAYGIPYFFDGPKPLRRHPLIGLLREITTFIRDKWNTGVLMAYVKTGFSGLTDNQGHALENYCLAHGVRRMHWESPRPWRFSPPEDPEGERRDRRMEGMRLKLWRPLAELRADLRQASAPGKVVAAVYRHLIRLKAEEACSRMANDALARGEPETAQLHQRAWQELMKLFDQTEAFLAPPAFEGGDVSGGGGYDSPGLVASVWESALEALETSALPPAMDQVIICSMDRSRSPLAKRVWIPGANEGQIPANIRDDSLITDEERRWFAERDVILAPDSRRRVFSEAYLVYVALTRASQSLSISCARADAQGKSQPPSILLEQVCGVFPGLAVGDGGLEAQRLLAGPAVSLPYLGMALQNGKSSRSSMDADQVYSSEDWEGLWRYVYRWFAGRKEHTRDIERLRTAFDLAPLGQPIPVELAGKIFGGSIKTSITRLERYQECPFAHYLAYGLALAPRDEYEIQPPSIGNFFHDSLQALMEEINGAGKRLGALSRGELDALVEIITERQLNSKSHEIFLSSSWYRYLSGNLLRILQSSARTMAYQENQGVFRAHALEADFGFDHADSLPPITIDLGGGRQILLRGRIDRIDRAVHPGDGQRYLRIIDYKSGKNDLALYEAYHGLKLQLALYMEAALEAYPGDKPAGMFYFQIHDPIIHAANAPEALDGDLRREKSIKAQPLRGYLLKDREIIKMMDKDYGDSLFLPVSELKSGGFGRYSGVLGEEDFRSLGSHARSLMRQAGRRIMEGDISLSPYRIGRKTACDYCPYGSVCRFDPGVPGHGYRYLPALTDEAVRERLSGASSKREDNIAGLE